MRGAITGGSVNLYDHLKAEIQKATEIKFIVSFVMESGVRLVVRELKKKALQGVPVKIITGTYLHVTEPSALYLLKRELGNLVDIRFYDDPSVSFHTKTYILKQDKGGVVFVGSSNLSRSALVTGVEWNYRLRETLSPEDFRVFDESFDRIFNKESVPRTEELLRQYAANWRRPRVMRGVDALEQELLPEKPEPRGAQIEALFELETAREEGLDRGLVVAATGIGKTYIAAFDALDFDRMLFVAHRREILEQAEAAFCRVHENLSTSFFDGGGRDLSGKAVFASIQSLGKKEYLTAGHVKPDAFDYIVVDEFHHAAADSYRALLGYFKPRFLLGLTATPYRMDGGDIFSLCGGNVVYEIHLKDAINRDLLAPFKYFGFYDETDYEAVPWRGGRYEPSRLEAILATEIRADLVWKKYSVWRGGKALGFCSSIRHAEFMADYFRKKGAKAAAVHSGNGKSRGMNRSEAVRKLENGELEILFAVDLFNEGVDIPSLDTVLFLRPTESYVVFLQQLGRGLRKCEGKTHLTVLDFIGNYKRAHHVPLLLAGENPFSEKGGKRRIDQMDFPEDCTVQFDLKLLDLFNEMAKRDPLKRRMKREYCRIRELLGRRPSRLDIYENTDMEIRHFMKEGYLGFIQELGDIQEEEETWIGTDAEAFLKELEKTAMSKSYKLPVLSAFLKNNILAEKIPISEVGGKFEAFYKESKIHQKDLRDKSNQDWETWETEKFTKLAIRNPVYFLSKRRFFHYDEINRVFMLKESLKPFLGENLAGHVQDILSWREMDYFRRRFKEETP